MQPGTNTIQVVAVNNTYSSTSAVVSASYQYVVAQPLGVVTNYNGAPAVVPGAVVTYADQTALEIGRNYTISATAPPPVSGVSHVLFSNWLSTGSQSIQ